MTRARFLRRAVVAAVTAAIVVLATPAPAAAHTVLLGTTPADGSVVTTVTTEVTLTFNEPVRADFSTVVVTGPDGRAYAAGELTAQDNVIRQPVLPLGSGRYEVAWRVVSLDGHPVSGMFSFTVQLPAELEPAEQEPAEQEPAEQEPAEQETVESSAPPPAAADAEPGGWRLWWWVPIGAVVVALALLLVRLGRRRAP
jgi:methionine-rich copper-binding protein CopC